MRGTCTELADHLNRQDRETLATLGSPERRRRFLASRSLVPLLLAPPPGEEGASDAGWWLSTEAGGRPVVHGGTGRVPEVSLSYSRGMLAIALSERHRVGVDLACLADGDGADVDWTLAGDERGVLRSVPGSRRLPAFLGMWALKEAAAKCLGAGAALPFAEVDTEHWRRDGRTFEWRELGIRAGRWRRRYAGRSYWLAVAWQERAESSDRSSGTQGPPLPAADVRTCATKPGSEESSLPTT